MTTTEMTAVEYEKQLLDSITKLNSASHASAREHAAATSEVEAAQHERSDASKSKAHGVKGADRAAEDANQRWRAALERVEQTKLDAETSLAERRLCEARLEQLRSTAFEELAEEAEKATAAAVEAGRKLADPLQGYLDLWRRAQLAWQPLRSGAAEHVRAIEREKGRFPGEDRISDAVNLPGCPIPAAAVTAVTAVAPRPFAMYEGFSISGEPEVVIETVYDGAGE